MISTDITGSANGDASQIFSLLSVVANPDVYREKLKVLLDATEEHKKYLALVAPASEIVQIREDIEADKASAKKLIDAAANTAKDIVSDAQNSAKSILDEANSFATKTKQEIVDTKSATTTKLKEAEKLSKDLQNKISSVEAAAKTVETKQMDLDVALEAAMAEKEKFLLLQKTMSDKVKAFAEDLLK